MKQCSYEGDDEAKVDLVFESNLVSNALIPIDVEFQNSREDNRFVEFIEDSNEESSYENSDLKITFSNCTKTLQPKVFNNFLCGSEVSNKEKEAMEAYQFHNEPTKDSTRWQRYVWIVSDDLFMVHTSGGKRKNLAKANICDKVDYKKIGKKPRLDEDSGAKGYAPLLTRINSLELVSLIKLGLTTDNNSTDWAQ